jgi:membrane-bound lytic murein transglycosylase A
MLPTTSDEDWSAMWPAFMQTCRALGKRDEWRGVCADASTIAPANAAGVRQFFASRFDAYRVLSTSVEDGRVTATRDAGLATGYYEPLLKGNRSRTERYTTPIYRVPPDLLIVDLSSVYPELRPMRLRGKLQGRRVVPYATRSDITGANPLTGNELVWVDDPIEAFFLQVQGSGRVQFDDGTIVRVGYGDQNGHPYHSIGRWLVDQGELTLDQSSIPGIKGWAARNPQRLKEMLDANPSYVFFRELPLGDPTAGPSGALGVPLTPGRSVAADPRYIPLGTPVVVTTKDPVSHQPFTRPMVTQDTGGAIRGPLRFDFFWGFGADAGERAGLQKYEVSAWLLVPRGAKPEDLVRR